MNNEKLEGTVAGKKSSSKILFIVLGLIVLGIVSLLAGIKIFSKLSISADTLPPMPGDPLETTTATATATTTTTSEGTGLSVAWFQGTNFETWKLNQVIGPININWGTGGPSTTLADNVSDRWTGFIKANYSESYEFTVEANDGVRMWVGNNLILDQWHDVGEVDLSSYTATANLTAGTLTPIKIEHYDKTGVMGLSLKWKSASEAFNFVPKTALYPGNAYTPSPTASSTSTPSGPDDPVGPPIDLTIKSGWNMISGTTLYNFDVSPITRAGMYFYSFNDPYLASRSWIVSSLSCTGQKDYFCTSLNQPFAPSPYVGYYIYNPGSQQTLTFNQVARLSVDPKNRIYSRGWHLLHWAGSAATKETVLKSITVDYNNQSASLMSDLISQPVHQASIKIYVVVDSASINTSAVKELSTSDTSTTISKIPQNSYFWIYLRRTKSAAKSIGIAYSDSQFFPPSLPNINAIDNIIMPPVPPSPQ